jgi:hypothetical protein
MCKATHIFAKDTQTHHARVSCAASAFDAVMWARRGRCRTSASHHVCMCKSICTCVCTWATCACVHLPVQGLVTCTKLPWGKCVYCAYTLPEKHNAHNALCVKTCIRPVLQKCKHVCHKMLASTSMTTRKDRQATQAVQHLLARNFEGW